MTTLPVARASPVLTLYLMSFAERVVATFFVAGFCCAGAASAALLRGRGERGGLERAER